MQLFSGNSNLNLAQKIVTQLSRKMGDLIVLGYAKIDKFSDGEASVEILENVRGQDVFIVQSTCAPANDTLMELLLMADALKRASARSIAAVIPYFGYARQDRRPRSARVPISARIVADLMQVAGIERILTVELHADQIQGFFKIPVDNVYSTKHFADDINSLKLSNLVIVSPDVGGVLRARSLAKQVGDADLVIIDKRRPKANESEVMNIIGDVNGKNCVIVDDIVDTGGTMIKAVDAIFERGAKSVRAYCTHSIMSGNAIENFGSSRITELVVTDTIPFQAPISSSLNRCYRQLSVADLLAEAILRIDSGTSIKDLS
jgi:ribose-phosphate pyrophosphokinase